MFDVMSVCSYGVLWFLFICALHVVHIILAVAVFTLSDLSLLIVFAD